MCTRLALIAVLLATLVSANTEKAIFLAPKGINIASILPNLEDLHVHTLTPDNRAIRTYLEAQFPTASAKYGKPTWLVLDQLTEGQRYEIRVCWAATQPTAFLLHTYELQTVFESSELITELSEYSLGRQNTDQVVDKGDHDHGDSHRAKAAASANHPRERETSVLLLQILAAADYYTTNKTLMDVVPPVYVDIILDPYVFNLLPRSLLPTIGYITVVAILSWFMARRVSSWIQSIAAEPDQNKKEQ